jgi:hypothetical protein
MPPQLHPVLQGVGVVQAQTRLLLMTPADSGSPSLSYTELLHTHFQHSVLDSLPEWLRKMDDSYGDGLSMGRCGVVLCRVGSFSS